MMMMNLKDNVHAFKFFLTVVKTAVCGIWIFLNPSVTRVNTPFCPMGLKSVILFQFCISVIATMLGTIVHVVDITIAVF